MKLDSRKFSQQAHQALTKLKSQLRILAQQYLNNQMRGEQRPSEKAIQDKTDSYCKKSSGLIQGLPAYISTWGLHRLSGDAKKFSNSRSEDTKYKGKVYREFLHHLKAFQQIDFDPDDEGSLVNMPLPNYTALNHLAMQLAKEWSFWASAVLGEPEE